MDFDAEGEGGDSDEEASSSSEGEPEGEKTPGSSSGQEDEDKEYELRMLREEAEAPLVGEGGPSGFPAGEAPSFLPGPLGSLSLPGAPAPRRSMDHYALRSRGARGSRQGAGAHPDNKEEEVQGGLSRAQPGGQRQICFPRTLFPPAKLTHPFKEFETLSVWHWKSPAPSSPCSPTLPPPSPHLFQSINPGMVI